jgi:hypothetical protein
VIGVKVHCVLYIWNLLYYFKTLHFIYTL